jgi:hypothetical protein
MVHLVLFLQAAQDGDGGLHAGLAHQDLLEAALQRGVFLDVLAVFVQRGGAHAVQLAARQRRLEHVARVHGALGLAGADHGVQLVDEDDGLAFVLGQFVQHGLQALLELAAELGAGQQRGHVERQHALALERLGHLAGDDALRQAFDDGGLAHAGLADQHGVVLGAALQHLDGAADFLVAADDRVELAQAGALGQVRWCISSGLRAGLRRRRCSRPARRARRRWPLRATCGSGRFPGDAATSALLSASASRKSSPAMNWSLRLMRFLLGGLQQLASSGPTCTDVLALHLGQLLDGGLRPPAAGPAR